MKGNTVFKIFCTLLIAAVASFAVTSSGDGEYDGYATLSRDTSAFSALLPETDAPSPQKITEPADTIAKAPDFTVDTVYVTATGTKYHLAGCSYLRSSANEITLEDAEANGYTPCSRCFKS